MPKIEIKSVCKCGKPKPVGDRLCPKCVSEGKLSAGWDEHKARLRRKYGKDPYSTPAWRRLRNFAIARDNGLCQSCLEVGRMEPFSDVDHKVPISQGGKFYDINNLQCLCAVCHKEKSAKEGRAGR